MRQILLKKHPQLSVNPAQPGELMILASEFVQFKEGVVNPITISGLLDPLSGTPKFRFSLPRELARQGVFLLGAYADAGEVIAYFSVLQGCGEIDLYKNQTVLIVESSTQDALTLVDGDARFRGGVLVLDQPDQTNVPLAPSRSAKKRKKKS